MKQLYIEIAGAGAGKTTNLAKKIADTYSQNHQKTIYCVSYTNNSVETIKNKLKVLIGHIPKEIKISTIHSFLYNEIIVPYNYLLYGVHFNNVSLIELPHNPKWRNSRTKQLKEMNILHTQEFFSTAKYIICGKSNDKRLIKDKRVIINEMFTDSFTALFIDEAQDIDSNFREILIKISSYGKNDIYLVGDPKQDLKGTEEFNHLKEMYPENINYIGVCHRSPQRHLDLSNKYIVPIEQQKSYENKSGEIEIFFENEIKDMKVHLVEKEYGLIYIYQKRGQFTTNQSKKSNQLYSELKIILSCHYGLEIGDIKIKKKASKFSYLIKKRFIENGRNANTAVSSFIKYGTISKSGYMKLVEGLLNDNGEKSDAIEVNSIERIKGREDEDCLFIISQALMPYLMLKKKNVKMNSHLYVGLTRSSKKLDMLFLTETLKDYSKEEIIEQLDL